MGAGSVSAAEKQQSCVDDEPKSECVWIPKCKSYIIQNRPKWHCRGVYELLNEHQLTGYNIVSHIKTQNWESQIDRAYCHEGVVDALRKAGSRVADRDYKKKNGRSMLSCACLVEESLCWITYDPAVNAWDYLSNLFCYSWRSLTVGFCVVIRNSVCSVGEKKVPHD